MACMELLGKDAQKRLRRGELAATPVIRHRFDELHEEGRNLIHGWARRALLRSGCRDEDCFEPLIFGWIALNGWACCVTKEDRDTDYIDALLLDEAAGRDFQNLSDMEFMAAAREFQSLWPIFSSKDLGYNVECGSPREQVRQQYRKIKPTPEHKPACAFRHLDRDEEIPIDWPHTLAAIYQVRCNLFHGYKGLHSENDVLIVSRAYRVLVRLLPMVIPNL